VTSEEVSKAWAVLDQKVAGLLATTRGPCKLCRTEARVTLAVVEILRRARAAGLLGQPPAEGPKH
jgi:hypothetical protein